MIPFAILFSNFAQDDDSYLKEDPPVNMKKVYSFIVVALLISTSMYLVWNANDQRADAATTSPQKSEIGIYPGYYAPDFTLENLRGEKVSLSDFQGKFVLLNFWAIWCPPCREEMPDINKFYKENKDQIVVLGVELGSKKLDVQKFINKGQYVYPILLDPDEKIGHQYRITAVPTTFILDRNGRILYVVKGAITYDTLNQVKEILLAAEKKK